MLHFGPFELDLETGELRRRKSGSLLKLQPQALKLLSVLAGHAGRLVTREQIRQQVWGSETFVNFDQGINFCIRQIRAALGDDPKGPHYILTVPRRGYRFIAPVSAQGQAHPLRNALSHLSPVSVPESLDRHVRLAVLPFEEFSGHSAKDYLADGMTEAVITELASIRNLDVISRTTVMQYKSTRKPLTEIARELNADAVIDGSVVRSGNRVRITARLIDAATDRHLWAKSYECDMRDIFAFYSDVARAITNRIQVKLSQQERARLASAPKVDPESYEFYLRGRYYWNKRTEAGLYKGVNYFEHAAEKDPRCALSYAGLADSYAVLGYWEAGILPPQEAFQKARAAAVKALEIDDTLAEAHTSLACVNLFYDKNWPDAERHFKRAIALNPNYATAHHWYALFLSAMRHHEEAIAHSKQAHKLEPFSLGINMGLAWCFHYARQHEEAIEQSQKTLEIDLKFDPAHLTLGLAYEQRAMYEEAIAEFQRAATKPDGPPMYLAALGHAYGISGRRGKAQKLLGQLQRLSRRRYVSPYEFALVYTGLGWKDQALEWLHTACRQNAIGLVYLRVEPRFDILRGNSTFRDLARQLSLD